MIKKKGEKIVSLKSLEKKFEARIKKVKSLGRSLGPCKDCHIAELEFGLKNIEFILTYEFKEAKKLSELRDKQE